MVTTHENYSLVKQMCEKMFLTIEKGIRTTRNVACLLPLKTKVNTSKRWMILNDIVFPVQQ